MPRSQPDRRIDVFFYGLFMDPELLRRKGLTPTNVELASVAGYSLRIGRRAALVPNSSDEVHGVVMSLTPAELARLYAEPSVQSYVPQPVLAWLDSGVSIPALCYNLPHPPSADEYDPEYASQLRSVGEKLGLPAKYLAKLK